MAAPLSHILSKIFARGFYKVHAGMLVFLFVAFISYCFFINTAGDIKLLTPSKALFYNFILLVTFISDPLMTGLFFLTWLLYTIKSWGYVASQLVVPHHQFVYYTAPAFKRGRQFKSWLYMQFIISLPFVFYALVAGVVGIIFHRYLMVGCILLFAALLICASAWLYVLVVNKLVTAKNNSWMFKVSRSWRKPFFSLFIYQVFDRFKVAYVITKLLSYLVIVTIMFSFADVQNDVRVAGLIVLGVVTTHSILIYQQHRFELIYLGLLRNLPFSMVNLYIKYIVSYAILLLPEVIWLVISFNVFITIGLLLLMLSLILLFHCLLYQIGLAVNKYLPFIFATFTVLFCMVLFGLMWMLIPLCLIISFTVFYFSYYKAQLQLA
ncbi:hypothetical protein BDD43_3837 [Mucilaginibacter gracilis]|uniref:ABC-2 type transport system permease protein n=1 Tax=Mucilaginibacter gracilis TaxID=423350 RepID=A0A495J3R8_9SPHI|nr:hypothetical protein [Mucilaginibacter gracilis]RKR83626.1 hypothetical protein BDD43_3837 [Mucilaginibacter gracilis]